MEIEVKVLDQVRVTIDGELVHLGERKQQLMVGVLAVQDGITDKATLQRLLWGDGMAPTGAEQQIYTYAKDLRQAFDRACPGARALLVTVREQGYRLDVPRRTSTTSVSSALRKGPQRWRTTTPWRARDWAGRRWGVGAHPGVRGGIPFGGTELQLEGITEDWRQDYQATLLICLRAELTCGRHEQILPELKRLAENDDYGKDNQAIAGMRMLAYYRSGRESDAVDVYKRLHRELRTFGNSPNAKIEKLLEQIMKRTPRSMFPNVRCALERPRRWTRRPSGRFLRNRPTRSGLPADRPLFNNHVTGANPKIYQIGGNLYERSDG